MKNIFKLTDKRTLFIFIGLLCGFLAWFNYEVVYSCMPTLGKRELLLYTFFNMNSLLTVFGLYRIGLKDHDKFLIFFLLWVLGVLIYQTLDSIAYVRTTGFDLAVLLIWCLCIPFYLIIILSKIKKVVYAELKSSIQIPD